MLRRRSIAGGVGGNCASDRDPLTGFFTRQGLIDHANAVSLPPDAVMLFLDIDDFRRINDAFDRIAGDRVLLAIARRIESLAAPHAMLARVGGDEFAIVLPRGGIQAGHRLAEQFAARMAESIQVEGRETVLAVSTGVAEIRNDESIAGALRRADVAMAHAKAGDHNGQIRPYAPEMSAAAKWRLTMEGELRQALAEQQFRLFYQPLVDLSTYVTCEVEALVRWQHPERGLLAPADFLPMVNEAGLMGELGRWVLREACRQGREWHERSAGERRIVVAVNLSPSQFRDPQLATDIVEILNETGFDPTMLRLEISESMMPDDIEPAILLMQRMRELGVRWALDDFGAGYAGWSFLQRCSIDAIKIDRSLIDGEAGERMVRPEMVEAMVVFAKHLGVPVSIEGIERAEQALAMRSLGIATAQGFFFARPQPADIVGAMLGTEPLVPVA